MFRAQWTFDEGYKPETSYIFLLPCYWNFPCVILYPVDALKRDSHTKLTIYISISSISTISKCQEDFWSVYHLLVSTNKGPPSAAWSIKRHIWFPQFQLISFSSGDEVFLKNKSFAWSKYSVNYSEELQQTFGYPRAQPRHTNYFC